MSEISKFKNESNTSYFHLKQLRKELRAYNRQLSDAYVQISNPDTPWKKWVWDNYYALKGAFCQVDKDLCCFYRFSSQCAKLFVHLRTTFKEKQLTQDELILTLRDWEEKPSLDEISFDFLRLALQSVFLWYAGESCRTQEEGLLAHAVQNLNSIAGIDYDEIISSLSLTERILCQDPCGTYPNMARITRTYYRHAVGRIARHCAVPEHQVAQDILECAQKGENDRERHVGFYLYRHDPNQKKAARRKFIFLMLCVTIPLVFSAFLGFWSESFIVAILLLIPLGELTKIVLRRMISSSLPPRHLPKMKLPNAAERPGVIAALVTLLPEADELDAVRGQLERLYHSNPGENVTYCLLADGKEARKPWFPQDDQRLESTKALIRTLNAQYGQRFVLVTRRRVWCKTQNKYCGWERKRGAIMELIRFARGKDTTIDCFEGAKERIFNAQYLLVLDGDTEAGFDSIDALLSAALHPLNQPTIEKGRVQEGFGIFSPCVEPRRGKTMFSLLLAGYCGHSVYAEEGGSFIWNLLGETPFVGKGLLHMDTFEEILSRKIPEETVLSHDVLEGGYLRSAFVSDAEVTEEVPQNAASWFARLHRWTRGDWQNILFLLWNVKKQENPLGVNGRLFLLENLRHSLLAPSLLLCIFWSASRDARIQGILSWTLLLALLLPFVRETIASFVQLGVQSFSSGPSCFSLVLGRVGWAFVSLGRESIVQLDAIVKSIWRQIKRRNLLEWTTAAQSTGKKEQSWISLCLGVVLLFIPSWLAKLFAFAFFLEPFASNLTSKRRQNSKTIPNRNEREQVLDWCAHMLNYFEQYANKRNHWLPPDNVQFSPVEAVARRTSPTNIGMMLLSYLAARDMGLLDSAALSVRLTRVLDSVDKLEKYEGNLYNWYATDDLRRLEPDMVSSVDSGNFLCSLVALREGIREYSAEEPKLHLVGKRLEKLLEECNFSIFYNSKRKLICVGVDSTGKQNNSHYDFLMSEARTASYYAIASRQVPLTHWSAFNRTCSRWKGRQGPISWTGTFFEYYMPHLLLPATPHTFLWEGLWYALHCQKSLAGKLPWGVSESQYMSFDDELHYQYKAHGVEPLAVNRRKEHVVSPYSSFLALPFNLAGAMENLSRLEKLGATGQYGFYEAVDFTPGRCKNGCGVIRTYMAHHIGMSMVACANALYDRVMQKRFMRNPAMSAASMLLQEKIPVERAMDAVTGKHGRQSNVSVPVISQWENPDAGAPLCAMLSNESLTCLFTDCGTGVLRWGNTDVTRNTADILGSPQGFFVVAHAGGETLTATAAPFYTREKHCGVFGEKEIEYRSEGERFTLIQKLSLEKGFSALRCTVRLESKLNVKLGAELLFYFEPILSGREEYASHPAFSKLFLTGGRDDATDTILFSRRMRDGSQGLWLCVGFEKSLQYDFTLKREEATPYPEGMEHLTRPEGVHMQGGTATPDGCCAIRVPTMTTQGGAQEVTLLICCGKTREDAINTLIALRCHGTNPSTAPLANDSMTARLGSRLLPRLLFQPDLGEVRKEALLDNTRGRDGLWELGIAGELPLVLYLWNECPDRAVLDGYLRFWRLMKLHRIDFDFCVVGLPEGQSLPVGVHRFDELRPESMCLLRAAACAIVSDEESLQQKKRERVYVPFETSALTVPPLPMDGGFHVVGGVFKRRHFYVERVTPLPFSHVLANPTFGCLLQDSSLGYTWFQNSRECRLSPWKNDIATGCDGEKMTLRINDKFYDLCKTARAVFSAQDACYEGIAGNICTRLEVRVDSAAAIKYLEVTLENTGEQEEEVLCAYSVEPDAPQKVMTRFEQYKGNLLVHQPWRQDIPCWMSICVPGEHPSFMTQREAFYAGDWQAQPLSPSSDPIAVALVRRRVAPNTKETVHFLLGAAPDREAVIHLMETPQPLHKNNLHLRLNTPDEPLNCIMEAFAVHQVLAGRIWGRTGFYQCSGAYGFRDQLQDAGACLWIDPKITKEQILRCCCVQFFEGDVLHWWHPLAQGTKGVRTRFSDDLLWLPLTVAEYWQATADMSLLETLQPYCKGACLMPEEQERYQTVETDEREETVYRHCVRALEHAWKLGAHNIPLIGAGDWNDGFSQIGVGGKGESVWLAMFFAMVLDSFIPVAEKMSDAVFVETCRTRAAALRRAVDEQCWDGKWYLRAFYDDGTPLGGIQNNECRIDLLPQAFSVLCGMPDQSRVKSSLDEAMIRLVDFRHGLIRLFTPPFDTTAHNPGYIKAYPSGIRENGGQYTHGALWLVIALLRAGRVEEGWALLDLINPAARCTVADLALEMKTEPYYLTADIYSHSGCYGHGGWSIYTGAAGWFCRAVLGELLGLKFQEGTLLVSPCVPKKWKHFSLELMIGETFLKLSAMRTGEASLKVDGKEAQRIELDKAQHDVVVTF